LHAFDVVSLLSSWSALSHFAREHREYALGSRLSSADDCSAQDEILEFQRRLIDAGLVDAR
jgi:hypothetical protein